MANKTIEALRLIETKEIVLDHVKIGLSVAAARIALEIPQKNLASEMKITQSYLSDLEHARRDWSKELFETAKKAMEALSK